MTTTDECLDALRRATEVLGESPTKAEYRELSITPSASTIVRILGGWNEAKRHADLRIYTQEDAGGGSVQPKPDDVEIPPEHDWEELTPQQRWYYKNRNHRIETKEKRRKSLRRWITEYKREHCACVECGESRSACLDFHHTGEKADRIARMVADNQPRDEIRCELERCELLCVNCH